MKNIKHKSKSRLDLHGLELQQAVPISLLKSSVVDIQLCMAESAALRLFFPHREPPWYLHIVLLFPLLGQNTWQRQLERGSAYLGSQLQGAVRETMATKASGSWSHCSHRQEAAEGNECPCLTGCFVSSTLGPWNVMSDLGGTPPIY